MDFEALYPGNLSSQDFYYHYRNPVKIDDIPAVMPPKPKRVRARFYWSRVYKAWTAQNKLAWNSWNGMKSRCNCETHAGYKDYGGRGIKVCYRWRCFRTFLNDMGPRPDGTSLDRIDVNGHYEPSNCRWATAKVQANNKRNSKRK